MVARESSLGFENAAPKLVELVALSQLLGRRLDFSVLIDGIELATLDGVEKDFSGLLDALEKSVVLGASSGGLLVRVMAKNLLAVGSLDLLFGSLVAVLGKT